MTDDTTRGALNEALSHQDPAWSFYRLMSAQEHRAMDDLLVKDAHPLAYEPGTQWDRFRRLHTQGYRF